MNKIEIKRQLSINSNFLNIFEKNFNKELYLNNHKIICINIHFLLKYINIETEYGYNILMLSLLSKYSDELSPLIININGDINLDVGINDENNSYHELAIKSIKKQILTYNIS